MYHNDLHWKVYSFRCWILQRPTTTMYWILVPLYTNSRKWWLMNRLICQVLQAPQNPQCYNQISTLWNVHKTDHSKRKDIGGFFLYLTNHLLLTCCRNFIFFKTCWNIQMGSNLFKECSAKRISILIHNNQHILEVFYNCE